jgi:hypothetical protein
VLNIERSIMLPDLPSLKNDIQSLFDQYLRSQVDIRLGPFNESPRHIVHEGRELRTMRADGSTSGTNLKKSSTEMILDLKDIPTLSANERIKKLDLLAEDLARQISEHLFSTLHEDLESSGQVVDKQGKPLDPDAIFEMIEKLDFEFDGVDGSHNTSIVAAPNMLENLRSIFNQIASDPALLRRHNELMAKKRMEWRDREAARKLVG